MGYSMCLSSGGTDSIRLGREHIERKKLKSDDFE